LEDFRVERNGWQVELNADGETSIAKQRLPAGQMTSFGNPLVSELWRWRMQRCLSEIKPRMPLIFWLGKSCWACFYCPAKACNRTPMRQDRYPLIQPPAIHRHHLAVSFWTFNPPMEATRTEDATQIARPVSNSAVVGSGLLRDNF
jgi:hypothetical protein